MDDGELLPSPICALAAKLRRTGGLRTPAPGCCLKVDTSSSKTRHEKHPAMEGCTA